MIHRNQYSNIHALTHLSEMKKLFWERSIDSVAIWLVGIFVPIYLLKIGFSFTEVLLFYMLVGAISAMIMPLGFKTITKLGANHTMVLGNIFIATFFFILYALPYYEFPLWLLALVRAGYTSFYYPAFHANFITSRSRDKTGSQIGKLNALTLLLHGISPLIGGLVASSFGFNWLYGAVIALIVLANAPLLLEENNSTRFTFSLRRVTWSSKKDFIANGLFNIPGFIESVIWPIGISLFVASYTTIGFFSSFMILISVAISLYVGKRQDIDGERRYINHGITVGVLGNITKLFVATPLGVLGTNLLSGTSGALLANSFIGRLYKNADGDRLLEYMFGVELAHSIFWAIFFGILVIASLFLSMKIVLILAILISIPAFYGVGLINDRPIRAKY